MFLSFNQKYFTYFSRSSECFLTRIRQNHGLQQPTYHQDLLSLLFFLKNQQFIHCVFYNSFNIINDVHTTPPAVLTNEGGQ